jgi:hypothetical protein
MIRGWLHDPVDARPVALTRIILGGMVVWNHLVLLVFFHDYFGAEGWARYPERAQNVSPFSLGWEAYFASHPAAAFLLLLVTVLLAMAFTLGFKSRWTSVLLFVAVLTVQRTNPIINNSGDVLVRMMLFWMMFMPIGRAWSVDALLGRGRASLRVAFSRSPISPFGLRLLQLQIATMYLSTFLYKIAGARWQSGEAFYTVSRLDTYARFIPVPLADSEWLLRGATWLALAIEAALGGLLLLPSVGWMIALLGIGFHLGMDLMINVPNFSWYAIAGLCCFLRLPARS